MEEPNPKVESLLKRCGRWQDEVLKLRSILLGCELTEELKWGSPCYTHQAANVVLIHVFKDYCALLFFKGALLKDTQNILVQQTKNVQSARQLRFTSGAEIDKLKNSIKTYVRQAIEVEKAGMKIEFKDTKQFDIPEEFQNALNETPKLRVAFAALTPGRQRAYLLHFSSAKQSKTRTSRIEKATPQILKGKGLDDE